MTDERPSDEEMDALIAEMLADGLLTVGTDAEGRETWALTPKGAQVATQMAMSSEDDALAMFDALLDAAEANTSARIGSGASPTSRRLRARWRRRSRSR